MKQWVLMLALTAWATVQFVGCSKKESPTEPAAPAPYAVADLAVAAGTDSTVTLAWTAAANPWGSTGGLTYDLRYVQLGSEGADRGVWTRAAMPGAHGGAGTHESFTVGHLHAGTAYVFSLAASLDGTSWSAPSNLAVGTAAAQPDATPPAGVTDLVQYGGTEASLTVAWSLAGDDTTYGRATSYEVRYAETLLDGASWSAASVAVGSSVPHANPAKLKLTIDGLTAGHTYYIALKAVDDAGNRSRMSNVVTAAATTMHTYYIKPDRSGDFPTIEEAVHASLPGDVVLVAPGRYTWTNQGTGDPVLGMIYAEHNQTGFSVIGEAGAEATILDAEQQAGVFYVIGGTAPGGGTAGITIEGFSFVNGRADGIEASPDKAWAGAGLCLHESACVVRNCVMRNNYATQGGGLWVGGVGAAVIENCLIENNSGVLGGGIMLVNSLQTITLRDCVVRDNHAVTTSAAGGGMFVAHVNALLERIQVYDNVSAQYGGGLSFSTLNADCVVRGCTVVRNQAPTGSAVRLNSASPLQLDTTLLAFNRGGAAFSIEPGAAAVAMRCSLSFGNPGSSQLPSPLTDLGGNLTVDPLLCADGLHPGPGSPCVPAFRPGNDDCGLIGALPGGDCGR